MNTPAPWIDNVHRLWDELADFGPAKSDSALSHALGGLSELIGAQQAYWLCSVRLSKADDDPLKGWRPAAIRYLYPHPDDTYKTHKKRVDNGQIDPSIVANVAAAGSYRINTQYDITTPGWWQSAFYDNLFRPLNIRDVLYLAQPLGEDIESWFVFWRAGEGQSPFGQADRERLDHAVRPLKWLHQQIALQHGLLVARAPLSQMERTVLHELFSGGSEKQIAETLGLSHHTAHEYILRIYRKYGVKSRAALTALWLMKS